MPGHDAVSGGLGPRCEFVRAGRTATLAEAAWQGRGVKFLTLRRAPTDVVRVRGTAPDVDYAMARRA